MIKQMNKGNQKNAIKSKILFLFWLAKIYINDKTTEVQLIISSPRLTIESMQLVFRKGCSIAARVIVFSIHTFYMQHCVFYILESKSVDSIIIAITACEMVIYWHGHFIFVKTKSNVKALRGSISEERKLFRSFNIQLFTMRSY